jgi:hypothetical protein
MPKGAVAPDTTSFRKKGTGQPILIDKAEGKCGFPTKLKEKYISKFT